MALIPDTEVAPSDQTSGLIPDPGFETDAAIQQKAVSNPAPAALTGILSPEEFAAQYRQSKEGLSLLGRLKEAIAGPAMGAIENTVKPIAGIVPAAYNEAVQNLQTKPLPSAIAANVGTGIKSAVEAGRLAGSELLNLPSQLLNNLAVQNEVSKAGIENPSQLLKQALERSGPTGQLESALIPSKVSEGEINKAYESYVQQAALQNAQAQPSQQIIGEGGALPGRVVPEIATGLKEVGKLSLPLVSSEGRAALGNLSSSIANTVKGAATKIGGRIAPATPVQQAMSAFDLTAPQAAENLPVVIKNVENITGVVPEGPGAAQAAVDLMETAKKKMYSNRLATNKTATEQGLKVDLEQPLEEAKSIVNSSRQKTKAQKETIIKNLEDRYSGSVSPEEAHNIQKDLNDSFSSDFKNGNLNKADPLYQAELTIRNGVANQMDQITKIITGIDARPYAELGNLIETQGGLEGQLESLQGKEAAIKTGLAGNQAIPSSRYKAAAKIVSGSRSPLRASGIENLDKAVEGAFKGFQKAPTGTALSPQEIAAGQARFSAPASTISPSEVATATAPDLESQIQALIKTYPKKLRSDPYLARLAAQQQLAGNVIPAQ